MKSAFFISPIGDDESDARIRSDRVLDDVLKPVFKDFGYEIQRADTKKDASIITNKVIRRTTGDDLVVADLSGHNPNVFYELAIRHFARKPCIHIMEKSDEKIPFDVHVQNTLIYQLRNSADIAKFKQELREIIQSIESGDVVENPITQALGSSVGLNPAPMITSPISILDQPSPRVIERAHELIALARKSKSWQVPMRFAFLSGPDQDTAGIELDRSAADYLVKRQFIRQTSAHLFKLTNEGDEFGETLAKPDAIDIEMKASYLKDGVQAANTPQRQRLFTISFFGINNELKAVSGYELFVTLPRAIIRVDSPTWKEVRQNDPRWIKLQFPIAKEAPLEQLLAGKRVQMAEIRGIMYNGLLEQKDWILAQNITLEFYCDGLASQKKVYPLAEVNPFQLLQVEYDSLEFDVRYELDVQSGATGS